MEGWLSERVFRSQRGGRRPFARWPPLIMKGMSFVRLLLIALLVGLGSLEAQQTRYGGKYEELNPRQQDLVKSWVAEFRKIFNKPADPAMSTSLRTPLPDHPGR